MDKLRGSANWVVEHEIWLLMAVTPVLTLSYRFPQSPTSSNSLIFPGSFALLLVPWLCRRVARGFFTIRTYLDLPILGLLAIIPISLYASTDLGLSFPIVYKMIAEIAIFYGVANGVHSLRQIRWLAALVLGGSVGISVLILLGTRWPAATRLPFLSQVHEHLPQVIISQLNKVGFIPNNPNIAGGVLAMLFPIALSSLLFGSKWIPGPLSGFSLLAMASALFLTQSQGAWIGLFFALLAMAVWRSRWLLLSIPVSAAVAFIAVQHFGMEAVADFILITESTPIIARRFEIWQRAMYMLQDFPYTGIGLGTFSRVAPVMYPFFLAGPDADIPHAHNIFLQAGVDLGIPGLVVFIGALTAFALTAWETLQLSKGSDLEPLAIGLLCGFIVYLTHGLFDSITAVSIKAGLVVWALLGFAVALWANLKDVKGP